MARGFEWMIAWRYLRREERPSLAVLLTGLIMLGLCVASFVPLMLLKKTPVDLGIVWVWRDTVCAVSLLAFVIGTLLVVWAMFGRWRVLLPPAVFCLIGSATIFFRADGWQRWWVWAAVGVVLVIVGVLSTVWSFYSGPRVLVPIALVCTALGAGALWHGAAWDWVQLWTVAGMALGVLGFLTWIFGFLFLWLSLYTTISTFGVFLGTMALIVVLSVMNGFEVDLRQKILGKSAHIQLTKEAGEFTEYRAVGKRVAKIPGVVAHSAYLTSEVLVATGGNYGGGVIKGIDPATIVLVTDIEKNLELDSKMSDLWPLKPAPDDDGRDDDGPDDDGPDDDGPDDDGPDDDGPDDDGPEDFSGQNDAFPDDAEDDGPIDFSGKAAGGLDASAKAKDNEIVPNSGGLMGSLKDLDLEALEPIEIGGRPSKIDGRVAALDGVMVGRELAKNLQLYIGQEVKIISPLGQDTPAGQVPRVQFFRAGGQFYTGYYQYDNNLMYVTMPALQRFLSLGDQATGIEIKVQNRDETGPVVAALRKELGSAYRVQDWKELNRNLFAALKVEKIGMFLVLVIIVLVASFSIVSNLIVVVVDKSKEIAILKSMGTSDAGTMSIFMIEGVYIGVWGTLLGVMWGITFCWAIGRFGLPLDPNVYYIDRLPVAMDPLAILAVGVAGVLVSFIATLYPSASAARQLPVDGLRYD